MAKGANRRTVFELYKIDPDEVKKSRIWFDEQIHKLSTKKITPNRVMFEEGWSMTTTVTPGKLYFYYYDPKHKETLPYYDQFPLVLPFAQTEDGFLGLNLHYLEYQPRMILFQELLRITGNMSLSNMSKIEMSWGLVKRLAKLKPAQVCVKRYLSSHVKSPFIEVKPEFWHTAMMLPVQRFVGESKEYVWKDSNRKYR